MRRITLFVVLVLASVLGAACTPAATPIPPTAPLPPTPAIDVPATIAAQVAATAAAQSQATATAQQQATTTAAALAQVAATAQAQATATDRAQRTITAQAAGTATIQAFTAALDAMVQTAPGKPYISTEGQINGAPAPLLTVFDPRLNLKDFNAEVQFFNPADGAIHPWDYGFSFRRGGKNVYRLRVDSKGQWVLGKADENQDGATISSGKVNNLDLSPIGSNTLRLFVRDTSAFLFVNGEYTTSMNVEELNASGSFLIGTGYARGNIFPGLMLRWKNLRVTGLQ